MDEEKRKDQDNVDINEIMDAIDIDRTVYTYIGLGILGITSIALLVFMTVQFRDYLF